MNDTRVKVTSFFLTLGFVLVIFRLLYWQVIAGEELRALGESQYRQTYEIHAKRGEIRTSDGFPLATNQTTHLIFAYKPNLTKQANEIARALAPILAPSLSLQEETTQSAILANPRVKEAYEQLYAKLSRNDVVWIPLVRNASADQKKAIDDLGFDGVGTEASYIRDYPEATMASRLLGFVGNDSAGNPQGYFGLEGFYDLELQGRPGVLRHETDAAGRPILIGNYEEIEAKDGRDIILHLNRAIQWIVEKRLKEGLTKYGAASGDVVVMEPTTGAVLAMASLPAYDPLHYSASLEDSYSNPVISETYEPGSTFKILVMAAALDTDAVTPETRCRSCDGPVDIGGYTIRTWNNQYHPDVDMREVIQYSDNVGMVFVAQQLGVDRLYEYLTRFGMDGKTGIDLEEETDSILRPSDEWKPIDLATAAFGQGVAITGMQMVRAVAAIANGGVLMKPHVVSRVMGESPITITPSSTRRVVQEETANIMKEMMVNAVENGEAKWAKPKGITVAGKTGTAQIPVAGHYDEEKTITSFVGFAPADDPKFVMLVRLREPESSPWGSETAAPLWFTISEDILEYYGVPRQ